MKVPLIVLFLPPYQGDVSLPKDIPEYIREWAEGEQTKVREELVGELSAAIQANGRDPKSIGEAVIRPNRNMITRRKPESPYS